MAFRYSALDVAAYFKWSSLPHEAETAYLEFLYQLRSDILARPVTENLDSFKQAVFREMYHVWSRGFENEFSDVNFIAPEGTIALFCDQEFFALESYMKLLAIHLLVSANLPFIRVHLMGFPMLLGIDGTWEEYHDNLNRAAKALDLSILNQDEKPLDIHAPLPLNPIHIGLSEAYSDKLFGKGSKRKKLYKDYREKMQVLREKSILEKKKRDEESKSHTGRKRKKSDGKIGMQFELLVGEPESVHKTSKEVPLSSLINDSTKKRKQQDGKVVSGENNGVDGSMNIIGNHQPADDTQTLESNIHLGQNAPLVHLEITSNEPVPPPAITHIVSSSDKKLKADNKSKIEANTKKTGSRKQPKVGTKKTIAKKSDTTLEKTENRSENKVEK